MDTEAYEDADLSFSLKSRRYIGNKTKLLDWIFENVCNYCSGSSFLDIFAGTGVVSERFLKTYKNIILNDFLYSNYVVYESFFNSNDVDLDRLKTQLNDIFQVAVNNKKSNYFSINFGDKFFGMDDARIIGHIREELAIRKLNNTISEKEFNILLTSLIYSSDRISNTVGHYDAYIKKQIRDNCFCYHMIKPIDTSKNNISIFQKDANQLAKTIKADTVFIDPPYNSRQYSRFYHVLENLVEWKKPKLFGTALKPAPENMSDYCRSNAPSVFSDLVNSLNCKYIVVTYNNTFNSKSSSSKNKITLEQIQQMLASRGKTKVLSKDYRYFNSGKTKLDNHKEYLFITEVKND